MGGFNASDKWVYMFKKKHRIVSRKGTKFVTQKQFTERPKVIQSSNSFVIEIQRLFARYDEKNIYNSDQSGFKLELISNRTLAPQGSKQVVIVYQKSGSATHSYTIQPTISASGHLLGPLFVVLQEKDGEFGPLVQQRMFTHPVLCVKASTSGLVTKNILREWYDEVFYKYCGRRCVLLLDSLTAYKDQDFYNQVKPQNVHCELKSIPPGTTGLIQPLDVGYFRSYKSIIRHMSNTIRRKCPEEKLSSRDNILKIQAAIHIQFSAPIFQNFLRHSWVESGYSERVDDSFFESPKTFCIPKDSAKHNCSLCTESAFIRCAWCNYHFCLKHFLFMDEIHFCCEDRIFRQ